MDITKASNFERLLYEILNGEPRRVRRYMEQFETEGHAAFTDHDVPRNALKLLGFESGESNHVARIEAIQATYKDSKVIIDPHTANAVSVARRQEREVPTICLATADPVKFEKVILEALGKVPGREKRFRNLEQLPNARNFKVIDSIKALKEYIRTHRAPVVAG